jgi:hypothetical protein
MNADAADDAPAGAASLIAGYVADSYEVLAQIDIAQRRLADIKDRLPDALRPAAATLTAEQRIALFAEFYWRATDLASEPVLLGLGYTSVGSVLPAIPPGRTGVPCLGCGADLKARSRSHRAEICKAANEETEQRARNRHWLNRALYCDRCYDRANKARDRAWDQEQVERQRAWQQRQRALRAMPFAEYLRTPEWRETRSDALERAGFRCQLCAEKDRSTLDVYHNSYARIGNEAPADLIVLCRPCYATNGHVLPTPSDQQEARS